MIDVLFFGSVADVMRQRHLRLDLAGPGKSLFSLRNELFKEASETGRAGADTIRMSVNRVVTRTDQMLCDGDEIAFFSVFSGG